MGEGRIYPWLGRQSVTHVSICGFGTPSVATHASKHRYLRGGTRHTSEATPSQSFKRTKLQRQLDHNEDI